MKIHMVHPFKVDGGETLELEAEKVHWEDGHTALRVILDEREFVVPVSNVTQVDLAHRETIGAPRALAHREYR